MSLNRLPADVKTITIPGTASGAYASGDQIGTPFEITNAVMDSGGVATISSVSLQDVAAQSAAVDVIFFSQKPSDGTDNAAWAPTASDAALILGMVKIPTTAYSAGSARGVGSVGNIGLKVKAGKTAAAQSNQSIWGLLVSRGTPNYSTDAPSLAIQVGINQD